MNTIIHLIKNENMKMNNQRSSTLILASSYLLTVSVIFIQYLNDMLLLQSATDFIIYAESYFIQVFVIGVVIQAARLISSEYAEGTIRLLLIRPVSRHCILFSKYAAMLLFSLKGFFISLLLILLASYLLFSPKQGNEWWMEIMFIWDVIIFKFLLFPFYIAIAFTAGILTKDIGSSLLLSITITALTMSIVPAIPGLSTFFSILIWSVIYFVIIVIGLGKFNHQEV